jgi:UDP-glucose 4-epimerase
VNTKSSILVTGGTGYIGSHTVVELIAQGHEVVIIDNLCNSKRSVIDTIAKISGRKPQFINLDLRDKPGLKELFAAHSFDAVLHFAGLKSVGESVAKPLLYYDNNIVGTIHLLEAMEAAGVKTMVFSSSATVYGDPASVPITEDFPLSVTNPYGRSKLIIEDILRDTVRADPQWKVALLRYFNPVGAHESGLIGEDPRGTPNNLMPYVAQVAAGILPQLSVYGADYPTSDGTGVRDYIHVVDLAQGHLAALKALEGQPDLLTMNLGTGRGYSVLEMIKAFADVTGRKINYRIVARRPGDVAECYADPSLAFRLMGWRAQRGVEAMCADAWRWQKSNTPGG